MRAVAPTLLSQPLTWCPVVLEAVRYQDCRPASKSGMYGHSGRVGPDTASNRGSTGQWRSLRRRERSVKPSAQPTLVRTQHLPPPAKTARWLRKRGPAGRFLLVTSCVRVRHYGSMHGSARVHMVYSVRAKLAVRITARFGDLVALGHGKDAIGRREAGQPPVGRCGACERQIVLAMCPQVPGATAPGGHALSRLGCNVRAGAAVTAAGHALSFSSLSGSCRCCPRRRTPGCGCVSSGLPRWSARPPGATGFTGSEVTTTPLTPRSARHSVPWYGP